MMYLSNLRMENCDLPPILKEEPSKWSPGINDHALLIPLQLYVFIKSPHGKL